MDNNLSGHIIKEHIFYGSVYHNIVHAPVVSNSYASYIMMKHEYAAREFDTVKIYTNPKWKQTLFNMEYLLAKEKELGKLVCAYCGKELIIFPFGTNKPKKEKEFMATVDHFYPKDNYNDPFDTDNLVIACYPHNDNKKNKVYPLSSLKFYDGPLKHKDLTINIVNKDKIKYTVPKDQKHGKRESKQ